MLRDHVPDPSRLDFIRWRVYTHHGRVAGSFRADRQLIAGDAAHLMPVWLGQGWNSGVRDAMNLGWKLATVLAGQAGDDLLDTYTDERLDHATKMVQLSMTMGNVIKLTNPVAVAARDVAGKVINRVPRARDYFGEMRFRPQPRRQFEIADPVRLSIGVRRVPFDAEEEIRAGDVIWFAPGEKHWHGAAPTTAMTHIAIQERFDGKAVDWMEKVTDQQYGA